MTNLLGCGRNQTAPHGARHSSSFSNPMLTSRTWTASLLDTRSWKVLVIPCNRASPERIYPHRSYFDRKCDPGLVDLRAARTSGRRDWNGLRDPRRRQDQPALCLRRTARRRANRRTYALLAQALNQLAESSNVVPIASAAPGDRARGARDEGEVEGEVLNLQPLTSENDEECSGGEIRTHNLAGAFERNECQHPLE